MIKTQLLICPSCEKQGKKNVLGELDAQGNLIVMRFKGDKNNYSTVVVSDEMQVRCGVCNETVFYRKKK